MYFKWVIQLLFFISLTSVLYAQALFFHSKISLDDPNVFKLAEDKNGHVWACTNNGLFLIQSNEIIKFNTTTGTLSNKFYCIYIDEHNRKWVGTDEGIVVIDSSDSYVLNFEIKSLGSIKEIAYAEGYIYLYSGQNYFLIYDINNNKYIYKSFNKVLNDVIYSYKIKVIDGRVFFTSDLGIYVYRKGKLLFKIFDKTVNDVININNKIFFTSENKLYEFTGDTSKRILYNFIEPIYRLYDFNNKIFLIAISKNIQTKSKLYVYDLLSSNLKLLGNIPNITDLCLTNNSLAFISTFGGGVSLYNYIDFSFIDLTYDEFITDFNKDDWHILIGTNKYLLCYDIIKNTTQQVTLGNSNVLEYIRKIKLIYGKKYVIAYSSPLSKKYKHLNYNGIEIHAFNAKNLFINDTLLILNNHNGKLELYNTNDFKCIDTLSINNMFLKVFDFYVEDAEVYIASNVGLYKLNIKNKKIDLIYPFTTTSVIKNNNYLIFTTPHFLGIIDFDTNVNQKKSFFYKIYISNYLIKEYDKYLFLYNYNQLYIINKNTRKFKHLNFPVYITNLKLEKNTLYLMTNFGLFSVNLSDVYKFKNKYHFTLNQFETNSKLNNNYFISNEPNFNFIINSSNNYTIIPLYFKYKIDDKDWIYIKDNFISFKINDSQNHLLYVQYSEDGISWNDAYKKNIKYNKPFYSYPIFFIVLIIVFILNVTWIIRYYYKSKLKRLKKKIELIRELEGLKYQNFTHSINIHFIMNTLNALQYFISQNKNNYSLNIIAFLGRLLRQCIDTIDKLEVSLHDEINRTIYYLKIQQIKLHYGFDFDFFIDESISINNHYCPSLILQPFVENSILHGFKGISYKGYIYIKLFKVHDYVFIQIIDNGIGLNHYNEKDKNDRKSIGIDYTIQRLKLFVENKFYKFTINEISNHKGVKVTIVFQDK